MEPSVAKNKPSETTGRRRCGSGTPSGNSGLELCDAGLYSRIEAEVCLLEVFLLDGNAPGSIFPGRRAHAEFHARRRGVQCCPAVTDARDPPARGRARRRSVPARAPT